MSYPQYVTGGSNIFWPIGDVFPLTPSWVELNAPESLTANLTDEQTVYYDLVIPWGTEYGATINLVDAGELLTDDSDDTVPTGFTEIRSRIWKDWGWSGQEHAWSWEQILNDDDEWEGDVRVWVPREMHPLLGDRVVWKFSIDAMFGDDPTRSMMGSLVVRR